MTKKLFSIIFVAFLFSMLLCLSSCSLLGGDKPPVDDPVDDPPAVEPEDKEPEDEAPKVDLSGITFPGYTGIYDGKAHSVAISGTLPEGVTVGYLGNGVKDAGTYTVSARFYLNGEYLSGMDKTATIVINRAVYDMYGVSFEGATVIAGGEPYNLYVQGTLPTGVRVLSYEGNGKSEVGEYTVKAKFTWDEKNYEPIEDMTATLKVVSGPAAFAGVAMPDLTYVYDGKEHELKPVNATVGSYIYEYTQGVGSAKNAGEYPTTVRLFDGTNEAVMSSTLKIKPAKLNVTASDKEVVYNGSVQSIDLVWSGTQPKGVTVSELGNGTAAIGTHNVRFRFILDESERGNYLYHSDINVTLTIKSPDALEATEGLEFKSVSGGYAVSGYTGDAAQIIIPKEYTNSLGVSGKVVEISSGAFMGNESITYVYIPDSVTTIGHNAFRGCESLKSVTMSNSLKVLGQLAFAETAIADVVIPDTLKAVGQGAFRGASVERIVLPYIGGSETTSNPYIGYIFGASSYAGNEQYVPESLKVVILSDECTIVPAYSFFGATSIEEVKIGKGVTEIGISAFQGCKSLIGLYIPTTVKDIPASAKSYNSPIYDCNDNFRLGTGVASKDKKPSGWGSKWDILNETARVTVLWNLTYDEYFEGVCQRLYFDKV